MQAGLCGAIAAAVVCFDPCGAVGGSTASLRKFRSEKLSVHCEQILRFERSMGGTFGNSEATPHEALSANGVQMPLSVNGCQMPPLPTVGSGRALPGSSLSEERTLTG